MSERAASWRSVGRYMLHEQFAAGGMASLHFGRLVADGGFARTVAIKRLHPQHAQDPKFAEMLLDEARLAARIRHPNVVPILDVVAARDELWLVMDYVHGDSLAVLRRAARRAKRPAPPAVASSIVCGVLQGLAAAHAATSEDGAPLGIVHRDVSPENVLVGDDGVARVVDFGVALAAGRSRTTREGGIKGKLGYMAPEILDGHQATPRSDVYSAGVVLWEALAGKRLFEAQHEGAVVALVLKNEVPPPSSLADLPPGVDEVVLRALARDPADRHASARDFAFALEAALAPATTREVAAWVGAVAGPALARRAETLSAVERGIARGDATGTSERTEATLVLDGTLTRPFDDGPTRVDGTLEPRLPGERTRTLALGATAAGVVLGTSIVIAVLAGPRQPAPSEEPRPAAIAAAPSATAEAPPPPPEIPAVAEPAPVAPAAAPTASAKPAHPTSPAARRPRPRVDCDPPYTIDDRGIHHYKPGCL